MDERDGRLPLTAAVVLAALAGVALDLAFPDPGWWPLAPAGVAAFLLAVRGAGARRGAVLGLVCGLTWFVPLLHWSGIYVGALPWLALATSQACFVALAGAALPWAWRAPGGRAGMVVAATGLWVLQEALRAKLPFGGFPWGRLAFSQADAASLGWAALGGAPLVSAAVAAAGACLALAVADVAGAVHTRRRRAPAEGSGAAAVDVRGRAGILAPRSGLAVVAAVAVIAAGPLAVRLGDRGAGGNDRSVQVAAVQGNVPTAGLEFNAQRRAVLDDHVAATAQLAREVRAGRVPAPDVVVWPENSSDIDPLRNPDASQVISEAADGVGVPLLVGAVIDGPGRAVSNTAIVWGPSDSAAPGPGEVYVKRHPVPFAEYIPYRSFFRIFSDKVDLVPLDFAAGNKVGVLTLGPARIGDVICFEVAYDDIVRDTVRSGADLLVVQTNNATFGYTDESVQQLAMSRLRAVEAGRGVIHISTVGVSALIQPDGTVVAGSRLFTRDVLDARLPLRTGFTVATRVGVWPELALAAAGVLLVGAALLRGRRRGRSGRADPDDEAPAPFPQEVAGSGAER
ncbi:MAG: apolipoprotein N-acyltransferase [Kineosporiaceae bacterium]